MDVVKELLENSAYIEQRDMVRIKKQKFVSKEIHLLFSTIITFEKEHILMLLS